MSTNGSPIETMSREEALLRASIPYVEARRAGRTLASIPAAAPETTSQQASGQEHHTKTLTPDMVDQLNAPLPPEAIDAHPTKAYLSSIKAIFSIERLNQVFGLDGWTYKTDIIENDPKSQMVVLKVTFMAPSYGIVREQFGGNDNPDRGDAYKGALTDALSKICGYLGIGMDVYKGHGPTKGNNGRRTPPPTKPEPKPAASSPAREVAERKIDGMQNGKSYEQVSAEERARPDATQPERLPDWTTSMAKIREKFAETKKLMPADAYFEILHLHKVDNPSEFRNPRSAYDCFQVLKGWLEAAGDPQNYQHFEATEGAWQ